MQIKNRWNDRIIFEDADSSLRKTVENAVKKCADLQGAYLRGADLQGADLQGANLRGAYLRGANLRDAYLRGANLRDAYLRGANLQGADLDYSCWPLWCGSVGVIVDEKFARQLAAHFCCLKCDSAEYKKAKSALLEFARSSHITEYCCVAEGLEEGGK